MNYHGAELQTVLSSHFRRPTRPSWCSLKQHRMRELQSLSTTRQRQPWTALLQPCETFHLSHCVDGRSIDIGDA